MVLAMDRSPCSASGRSRIGLALALVACAADLGCSKLKSSRRDAGPPMLGREAEGNDVYAEARRPSPAGTTESPRPLAATLAASAFDDPESPPSSPGPKSASDSSRPATDPRAGAARLIAEARSSLDSLGSYQVAMHRQERVNGVLQPEEDVTLAVRRRPLAVRLTWPSGAHKGREVLYRADEPGGLIHVNPGPPLPRINLAPDSPLVMRNSRHPITEAGFDSLVRTLEDDLQQPDQGELVASADGTLTRVKPGGETWKVTLDPRSHLPSVVECTGLGGELQERYAFRDFQVEPTELADPAAFDPDLRWGPPRGLFGLGRASKPDSPTPR